MTATELSMLKTELLNERVAEFNCRGEHFLIQIENNKGWDYLGLWRVSGKPVCLTRAFFDSMSGVDKETVDELLAIPFLEGKSLPELLSEITDLIFI